MATGHRTGIGLLPRLAERSGSLAGRPGTSRSAAALPPALDLAAEAGTLPAGRTTEELSDRLRSLSRKPLPECLEYVRNLIAASDGRTLLPALASRDAELMDEFREVLRDAGHVLAKALAQTQSQAERLAAGTDATVPPGGSQRGPRSYGRVARGLAGLLSSAPQ